MADLSSYYGKDALTVELWAKPATGDVGSAHGFVSLGPAAGVSEANHTFALWMDDTGNVGGATNIYRGGVKLGSGSMGIESAANAQSTAAQHLALVFQSGQQLKLLINGMPTAPTANSSALTGSTVAPASGGLRTGVGPMSPVTGDYAGEMAELRIHGVARSDATIAAEYLSYADPDGFSGHSTFDLVNANQGPVAVPLYVTCGKGATQDYDVLAQCFEPDGDTMTISAATNGAHGTVTRISSNTKVRYVHDNTSSTNDSFTYTISDGALTSTSKVLVTVVEEIPASLHQFTITSDGTLGTYLSATRTAGDQANIS